MVRAADGSGALADVGETASVYGAHGDTSAEGTPAGVTGGLGVGVGGLGVGGGVGMLSVGGCAGVGGVGAVVKIERHACQVSDSADGDGNADGVLVLGAGKSGGVGETAGADGDAGEAVGWVAGFGGEVRSVAGFGEEVGSMAESGEAMGLVGGVGEATGSVDGFGEVALAVGGVAGETGMGSPPGLGCGSEASWVGDGVAVVIGMGGVVGVGCRDCGLVLVGGDVGGAVGSVGGGGSVVGVGLSWVKPRWMGRGWDLRRDWWVRRSAGVAKRDWGKVCGSPPAW